MMRDRLRVLRNSGALVFALFAHAADPEPAHASSPLVTLETEIVRLSERLRGSIVGVESWSSGNAVSVGSGIIVDSTGVILTTSSVVRDAQKIIVRALGRGVFPARVVGLDPLTNLAVLEVFSADTFTPIPLVARAEAPPGSWVMILGNSYGAGPTVAVGNVAGRRHGYGLEEGEGLVQVNAPVNPGDSGAAVVNSRGEVIGILFAAMTPEDGPERSDLVGGVGRRAEGGGASLAMGANVGFAMPIGPTKRIVEQIRAHGRVVRGYLGLRIQPVEMAGAPGLRVDDVYAASPADRAGFLRGDILIAVNGKPVGTSRSLQCLVARSQPNDEIRLSVRRGEATHELSAVVGELPELLVERGTPEADSQAAAIADASPTNRAEHVRASIEALKRELAALQQDLKSLERSGKR
ncbi:MAG: S1C family serine protease [bacterium]